MSNQKPKDETVAPPPHLPVIAPHVNGLNSLFKRQSGRWTEKQNKKKLQGTHPSSTDKHGLKAKAGNLIPQANGSQKKGGAATFISDKRDFKPEKVTRGKDGSL